MKEWEDIANKEYYLNDIEVYKNNKPRGKSGRYIVDGDIVEADEYVGCGGYGEVVDNTIRYGIVELLHDNHTKEEMFICHENLHIYKSRMIKNAMYSLIWKNKGAAIFSLGEIEIERSEAEEIFQKFLQSPKMKNKFCQIFLKRAKELFYNKENMHKK